MKAHLISLALAALLFSSCAAERMPNLPDRSYPITLTATLTNETQRLEGVLTVTESGDARFCVSSPATLAGFTFTTGENPALTYDGISAPLSVSTPALADVAALLTLDSASILEAEQITLGGMPYNRVTCVTEGEDATFYLTADGRLVRIECGHLSLDVLGR